MSGGFYADLIGVLWVVWALYWWISAADGKKTQQRESLRSRSIHLLAMVLAAVLLGAPSLPRAGFLFGRFLTLGAATSACGSLAVGVGLGFSVWARVHLGRNWSGRVSLKEDHELIRTGPYAVVRHPIYGGLLLAMGGTACVIGEWRGVLAVVLMAASYWRKLRVEERLMRATFGDAYRRYCEHTSALIPYLI